MMPLVRLLRDGSTALPACMRALATSASSTPGLVEVREYTLKPEGVADFLQLCKEYAGVRASLLPFKGAFTADVGSCLHRMTHFYTYDSFDQRDDVRAKAAADPRWKEFIRLSRPHVQFQENKVMLQATPVYEVLGLPPTSSFTHPPNTDKTKVVYEMRCYQLHPGYGSVPKLVEAFRAGLPSKVAADTDGKLVFFGYTDVGMLNNVVELWRYPSAQACIRARQAARLVPAWRETIAAVTPGVQHFTSAFLHPTAFSPWHEGQQRAWVQDACRVQPYLGGAVRNVPSRSVDSTIRRRSTGRGQQAAERHAAE